MKPIILTGIVLVVLGALVLAYQGINYTRQEKVLDVGPIHATAAVTSTYGTVSSPLVVLVWIYYSAQILLFGAEITYVYANKHGSRGESASRTATPGQQESIPYSHHLKRIEH